MEIHKWKNNELNRLLMERFLPKKRINESPNDIIMSIMEYDPSLSQDEATEIVQLVIDNKMSIPEAVEMYMSSGEGEEPPGPPPAESIPDEEPPGGPAMMHESKKDKAFRKKVRLMLESINFKKDKAIKKNKRVKVRRRRK